MSSLVHTSSSPIFNTIRNSSIECIEKVKEGATAASPNPFLYLEVLTTQQKQQLFSILYKLKNFSHLVKDILTDTLNTVHHPFINLTEEDEQKTYAVTVLEVLKSLVSSIKRFTDESLESIGREASETLIEVTRQLQELEMELEEAKVSERFYNAIFSAVVMAFAVLVAPVATLAVAPFLQRFDLVWEDVMEKPILDKLKVFQTVLFKIHSAIAVAGKIQDSVYGLSSSVSTDPMYAPRVFDYQEFKLPTFKAESLKGGMFIGMPNYVVSGDIKFEVGALEEGIFLLPGPFSEVEDVTKRLMEMEKVVAAAMAQVEMAEHELEQLIQTLEFMPLHEE